jgi:lipoate-protein ligase A
MLTKRKLLSKIESLSASLDRAHDRITNLDISMFSNFRKVIDEEIRSATEIHVRNRCSNSLQFTATDFLHNEFCKTASLKKAVELIMEHLNIEFKHEDEKTILVEKDAKEKTTNQ